MMVLVGQAGESYPGLYQGNYGSPAGTQSAAISSGGAISGSAQTASFTYQGAGPQIQTITGS
jgi:hypothetical protein